MLPLGYFFLSPYTLYPALVVVLFWLASPSVSLLLVCFSGVVHMSQPVAGYFTHNGKQAQDPPGSLHTIVSPVEFPQGEGSTVIHRMKNYLLYRAATCLCSLSAAVQRF